MARTRRRRRGATTSSAEPNVFSRLVPDAIERPAGAVVGGSLGLVGNLLGDVKDAVVGLPVGVYKMATDPIESGKAVLGSTWHTWSPLFHGDVVKWAKQTYDHPLAPILDVATVFTVGAAGAAKGASLVAKAGDTTSTVAKLAALREAKMLELPDPKGERLPVQKPLSTRPGRRIVQETMLKLDQQGRLPKWYTNARYDRAHLVDVAHRAVGVQAIKKSAGKKVRAIDASVKAGDYDGLRNMAEDFMRTSDPTDGVYEAVRLQMEAIIRGAEALTDITELGKAARSAVMSHMYVNLLRHNPRLLTLDEAKKLGALDRDGHNRLVVATEHLDTTYSSALRGKKKAYDRAARKLEFQGARIDVRVQYLEQQRAKYAEAAHSVDSIQAEIQRTEARLTQLENEGGVIAGGYTNKKGEQPATLSDRERMTYISDPRAWEHDKLTRLQKMKSDAIKARAKHEDVLRELETKRVQRTDLETKVREAWQALDDMKEYSSRDYFARMAETFDTTVDAVENFGAKVTTRNPAKAAHQLGDDGVARYWVVPKHDAYNMAWEGGNSLRLLHKVLHKPTAVWKTLVVGYAPRTITNNGIGNWLIYAARDLPSTHGILAISDAFRVSFGRRAIPDDVLFPKNHWLHRYFEPEMSDVFGVGTDIVRIGEEGAKKYLRQGLYPVTGKIERNQRAMTLYSALRAKPEVRAAIRQAKKDGYTRGRAVDVGIERALKANPNLQADAALSSRRLMGDYVTMSETEKFLRDIVPFYLWQRHILKTTGNMMLDQPGRLAFMSRLSEQGIETTEGYLGEIPEYLRGAIPLAMLGVGERTGRKNIMLTASLNPFATVGEMASQADALLTGKHSKPGDLFMGVNPLFTGAVEAATGTSLLTGQRRRHSEGGVFGAVFSDILENLPETKILDEATRPDREIAPSGTPYLYKKDLRSQIGSFLGVPIRDMSQETAERYARMAAEAAGKKDTSTRRRKRRERG